MFRLSKLQLRSVVRARSLQLNKTRLVTTVKKFAPASLAFQTQQKVNTFSTLWRTTALIAATGLAYNLANSNVLALEANDRKLN